jgi:hypothetical protein
MTIGDEATAYCSIGFQPAAAVWTFPETLDVKSGLRPNADTSPLSPGNRQKESLAQDLPS